MFNVLQSINLIYPYFNIYYCLSFISKTFRQYTTSTILFITYFTQLNIISYKSIIITILHKLAMLFIHIHVPTIEYSNNINTVNCIIIFYWRLMLVFEYKVLNRYTIQYCDIILFMNYLKVKSNKHQSLLYLLIINFHLLILHNIDNE